jgi:hypothetical protein
LVSAISFENIGVHSDRARFSSAAEHNQKAHGSLSVGFIRFVLNREAGRAL